MKRPSYQHYPADWRNNAKLRRCSWEARGVWIEVLGLMHDSDEYGILRWDLKEISLALGAPIKAIKELVSKDVMKGADKGEIDAFIYTPVSGRKQGDPVTLIPETAGPLWYSPRMVRDEYVRTVRGQNSRFGEASNPSPKGGLGENKGGSPKPAPTQNESDGSTSSSSSSSSFSTTTPAIGAEDVPDDTPPKSPPVDRSGADQKIMIHAEWQPSEHFDAMLYRSGIKLEPEIKDQIIAEFLSFRIPKNELKTQAEWDHGLLNACIHWKSKNQLTLVTGKAKQTQKSALHNFDNVDYSYGVNPDGSF